MVEHATEALDDRQAETQALGDPGALVEPLEFLEHHALSIRRDAEAGVPDLDAEPIRPAPASDEDGPTHGVLDGVGHEVLQEPAHQPAIGADRELRGNEPKLEPLRPRRRKRKSTRLNSSHITISYAVFCLKKKKK